MANEQNLIPFTSEQSREEAKMNGSLGGKKSGESRRHKKELKEVLTALLEEKQQDSQGVTLTTQEIICLSLLNKAAKGDVKAFEVVRDTIGQKPVDRVAQTTSDGKDIPVNDLSKVPTATLLQMAERAGVNVDADEK